MCHKHGMRCPHGECGNCTSYIWRQPPQKKKKSIFPASLTTIIKYMGGVDIANEHRAAYETQLRARRLCWPLWIWSINVSLVNDFKIQSILFDKRGITTSGALPL